MHHPRAQFTQDMYIDLIQISRKTTVFKVEQNFVKRKQDVICWPFLDAFPDFSRRDVYLLLDGIDCVFFMLLEVWGESLDASPVIWTPHCS